MTIGRGSAEYSALTRNQRQDVRASQRTFEGAYLRTAFGKLSFGLLIIRVFNREFLPLGVVYVVSAMLTAGVSLYQRVHSERHLLRNPSTTFETAGNVVALTALIDLGSFITLLVLLTRL